MPRSSPYVWRRPRVRLARAVRHTHVLLALLAPRILPGETPPGAASPPVMAGFSLTHNFGGTASVNTNTTSSTKFTLTNLSVNDTTVNLVITVCNGALAPGLCTRSPASVFLPSGRDTTITTGFKGGTSAGTGTLTLRANSTSGTQLAIASVTVTVTNPPPPPGPTVSTAPHVGDRRDVSQCVADCFEATLAYALPAYTSLDVPRSVTLLYRSGSAYPQGTLTLDVSDTSALTTQFRLKLKDPNGAYVTFANDSQQVYFTRKPTGATRLVAQFPATNIPTSAALYTAEVTNFRSSGAQGTTSASVRIIVINDQNSPYGAGVSLVGVQRILFNQSDGVLVTDGTGSATFFSGTCNVNTTCSYTSPSGEFSTLSTSGAMFWRTYPDGTTLSFYPDGHLYRTIDRFGSTTQVNYGYNGPYADYWPLSITDPTGQSISFWYRDAGSLYGTWKEGSLGKVHTPVGDAPIGIDASNNAKEWVELGGGVYRARMTYGGQHLLDTAYSKANFPTKFTYRYGATLAYAFLPAITITGGTVAQPVVAFRNAADSLLERAAAGQGTNANPLAALGDQRAMVIGPRNDTTRFSLNRFGAPQKTYAPLTPSDSVEYDSATGLVTRTISPTGVDVRYTWSVGKLTNVKNVTLNTNDSTVYASQYSLPIQTISSTAAGQWFTYDQTKTGWPLQYSRIGSATATPTTYSTDAFGRNTAVVDPAGHQTLTYYAASGLRNTDSVKTALVGIARWFQRDSWGRVVGVRDPSGAVTTTALDVLNRPGWVASPLYNDTTRYQYDLFDEVGAVTDAKNQVYTYLHNALGWTTKMIAPTGAADSTTYQYDVAGNVTYSRSRAGRVVTFEYDLLNRMKKKIGVAEHDTITYAYSDSGRWVAARTVSRGVLVSTDTIFADSIGRTVTERTFRPGTFWDVKSTYNSTDPDLSMVAAIRNGAGGAQAGAQYFYDTAKRLQTISPTGSGRNTTLGYNADWQDSTVTLPSGLTETSLYTSSHALARRTYSLPTVRSALDRAYRTDSLARLVERQNGTAGEFQNFYYDSKGRFYFWEKWSQGGTPTCQNVGGYGYDCSSGATRTFQLGTRYDSVENHTDLGAVLQTGNRLTTYNGFNLTYDADGNMVKRVGATTDSLDWDDFGQLKRVIRGGSAVVTFDYDGFGRRVRKVAGSTTIQFVWDGDQVILEADASGNTTEAYTYYPGIDRLHSVTAGGATYYASIEPATGDVNGLVKEVGDTVKAQYSYTPWGEFDTPDQPMINGARVNSFRWKGLAYDSTSGLYYMRARYYDPKIRRFISEDPIGLDGGINTYAFVRGDPVNGTDPSGLRGCTDPQKAAGGYTYTGENGNQWCYFPESLPPIVVVDNSPYSKNFGNPCARANDCDETAESYSLSLQRAGIRYKLGNPPGAEDCSSYCAKLLASQGCVVPRTTTNEMRHSTHFDRISFEEAGQGDVIVRVDQPFGHMGEIVGRSSTGDWKVSDWGRRMNTNPRTFSYWGPGRNARGWFPGHFSSFSYYRPRC